MGFKFNAENFKEIEEMLCKYDNPENNYLWWHLLKQDEDTYIDIRNSGQINIYCNGGSLLAITKTSIETNKKFIPLCKETYVTLNEDDSCLSINKDSQKMLFKHYKKIRLLQDKESVEIMKGLIKAYYQDSSEKGIQGHYALNRTEEQGIFIDTEFACEDNDKSIRIDLVYLQLKNKNEFLDIPKLYFVELKTQDDERLFTKPSKKSDKNEGKRIDEQIEDYYNFLQNENNIKELKKYYLKLIKIKSKHNLIKTKANDLLNKLNEISDIDIERKPVLLIGDSSITYPIEKIFEGKENKCKEADNKYLNKITDKNIYEKVRQMTFCRVYRGVSTNHINITKPRISHIYY